MGTRHLWDLISNLEIPHGDIIYLPFEGSKPLPFFIGGYENLPECARQVSLQIKHALRLQSGAKIGVVCTAKTALFLNRMLEQDALIYSAFGRSLSQNPFFQLFQIFCRLAAESGDTSDYLHFIKHENTKHDKEGALLYEKSLRGLGTMQKPALIETYQNSFETFKGFLSFSFSDFIKHLTPDSILNPYFIELEIFLNNIKNEADDFAILNWRQYSAVLQTLASNQVFRETQTQESASVQLLSPIEARYLKFDKLIICDLNSGVSPRLQTKNKILNGYLQEILELKKDESALEWLDFTLLLYAAPELHLSSIKTEFGQETLEESRFLLHVLSCYETALQPNYSQSFSPYFPPPPAPEFKGWPNKIFVTQIESLMKNPYDFYVNNILKIKKQEPIKDVLLQNDIGTILHGAILAFFNDKSDIPSYCCREFIRLNQKPLALFYDDILLAIQDFFARERSAIAKNPPLSQFMEQEISMPFVALNGEIKTLQEGAIEIAARPDRIDFYNTHVEIIDYKVYSSEISALDLSQGLAPQLFLQSLIVQHLYPQYLESQIFCYYYYIDLKTGNIRKTGVPSQDFKIIKNSLETLLTLLPSFFYNENARFQANFALARVNV